MQIVHLSPISQISESRSSTICKVVEQSDHHCGDDVVERQLNVEYFCSLNMSKIVFYGRTNVFFAADKAIASRAVFVIVSGWADGNAFAAS